MVASPKRPFLQSVQETESGRALNYDNAGTANDAAHKRQRISGRGSWVSGISGDTVDDNLMSYANAPAVAADTSSDEACRGASPAHANDSNDHSGMYTRYDPLKSHFLFLFIMCCAS